MAFEGPFPQQPESSIASYNWADTAFGVGYRTFYGVKQSFTFLSPHPLASQIKKLTLTDNTTSLNLKDTSNWDIIFNKPDRIKGDVFVNATVQLNTSSVQTGKSARLDIEIYLNGILKSSGTGLAVEWGNSKTGSYRLITKATISDVLNIKQGDTLRVTTKLYLAGHTAATHTFVYWMDGAGLATAANEVDETFSNPTDIRFNIPFVVDL